jgi:hypothetical protein
VLTTEGEGGVAYENGGAAYEKREKTEIGAKNARRKS